MVRYRTAVKDPKDIAFMFWAIGIGLTCGIGFYLVAAAGSAFIGVIMIVISLAANIKGSPEPCIAVVRLAPDANINRVNFTISVPIEHCRISPITSKNQIDM